jgi:mRNA interferase HigB
MEVHLIKKKTIEEYVVANARSRSSFRLWLTNLNHSDWEHPGDVIKTFGSADLLGNGSDRVVFDIGGNNYRMICKYQFGINKVRLYVKWIGTHAQYTHLCNSNKQYTVNIY